MEGRSDEVVAYHTHFLTNRGVGEAYERYSSLVKDDVPVTRSRYAFLVIVVAINLSMSIAVLSLAVHRHPPARRWKLESQTSTTTTTTTTGSDDWMACRRDGNDETLQYCATIDDEFCKAASNVIAYYKLVGLTTDNIMQTRDKGVIGSSEERRCKLSKDQTAVQA